MMIVFKRLKNSYLTKWFEKEVFSGKLNGGRCSPGRVDSPPLTQKEDRTFKVFVRWQLEDNLTLKDVFG